MLAEIITALGENYNTSDSQYLEDLIDEITYSALSISNKTTINDNNALQMIVKRAVIEKYLQRGGEGFSSINEMGKSASLVDPIEKMRQDIIKEGLRKIC